MLVLKLLLLLFCAFIVAGITLSSMSEAEEDETDVYINTGVPLLLAGMAGVSACAVLLARKRTAKQIYLVLKFGKYFLLEEIAWNIGKKPARVREGIAYLVKNGYLTEYKLSRDGKELIPMVEPPKEPARIHRSSNKCANCGAKLKSTELCCEYCGTEYFD
jgi:hypothetical protein